MWVGGDKIVNMKDLTPEQKRGISSIYPVVNKELAREFGVVEHYEKVTNRDADTLPKIRSFAKEYLFTEEFNPTALKVTCDDFITVPDDKLSEVTQGPNVLLFGRSQVSFAPYTGLFGNHNGGGYGRSALLRGPMSVSSSSHRKTRNPSVQRCTIY